MKLQHGNRIRRDGGEQLVRELKTIEAEAMASGPTEEEIRQVAYDIYLKRNGAPGDAVRDWLEAEDELRARKASAQVASMLRTGAIASPSFVQASPGFGFASPSIG